MSELVTKDDCIMHRGNMKDSLEKHIRESDIQLANIDKVTNTNAMKLEYITEKLESHMRDEEKNQDELKETLKEIKIIVSGKLSSTVFWTVMSLKIWLLTWMISYLFVTIEHTKDKVTKLEAVEEYRHRDE